MIKKFFCRECNKTPAFCIIPVKGQMLMVWTMNAAREGGSPAELEALLEKIAYDDMTALEGLYRATHRAVYAFALSVLKNTHDAEDVLHDCYVAIASAAEGYRPQGKPLAWILTIARNLCNQKFRERKRTAEFPLEDWQQSLAADPGLSQEDRLILGECMTILTDEERQIVALHAISGFKHREIASVLALPLATVLSKYHRALKKLRNHLEGETT